MEICSRSPKMLPWLAHRFDVPESVARQVWHGVVRDADARFPSHEQKRSAYWSYVMEKLRERLARIQRAPLLGVLQCQEQFVVATFVAGSAMWRRPWCAPASNACSERHAA